MTSKMNGTKMNGATPKKPASLHIPSSPIGIVKSKNKKPASPLHHVSRSKSSSPILIAAGDSNLSLMKSSFPSSLSNLSGDRSLSSSPTSQLLRIPRSSPCSGDESPVVSKRRRMNTETSSVDSPCGSPPPQVVPGAPGDLGSDYSFDEFSDSNVSAVESPTGSPAPFRSKDKGRRVRYRKDELWAAIRSDYQYLMDEEIIETCKSTESDLSWESDDLTINTKVSFTEFMQQYKELTDWLTHIQLVTQRKISSLSEKYLNYTYHEEMMQRSPRRKLFNDYAKQLMRRYPTMKEPITIRLTHLNSQWEALESAISPSHGCQDLETIHKDLESDLNGLRKWLHDIECSLQPLCINPAWTTQEVEEKLAAHQELQRDIESHSKVVSAVLKLSEHLKADRLAVADAKQDANQTQQLVAVNLERRWHAIWLQSLEWQCRLEEALNQTKGIGNRCNGDDSDDGGWGNYCYTRPRNASLNFSQHDNANENQTDDDYDEEDIFSDNSISDVIPFHENDYEKITVDNDCQTDDLDGKVTPSSSSISSSGRDEVCDMDQGFDSALGRSVSDDNSIHVHLRNSQAQPEIESPVSKVVSFSSSEMKSEPLTETVSSGENSGDAGKPEKPDAGYSSESHSNDEPEYGILSRDGTKQQLSLDAVVLRRKVNLAGETSDLTPSPSSHEKTWRHSMTSAYDTSSNCSEANWPQDLDLILDGVGDTTLTGSPEAGDGGDSTENKDVQSLISSTNTGYYRMTPEECDSEASQTKFTPIDLASDEGFMHSTPIKDDSTLTPLTHHKSSPYSSQSQVSRRLSLSEKTTSSDGIKKLINRAELLISGTGEADTTNDVTKPVRRKKKARRHRRVVLNCEPSVPLQPDDDVIGACDASSEGTSSSESEEECSTGQSSTSVLTSKSTNASTLNQSDRANCSVTELYELSNRLDLSPFSISESAIYKISESHSRDHNLRRTISESSALPHKRRKRKLKRASSDDTEKLVKSASGKSFCSAPAGSSSQEWRASMFGVEKTGTSNSDLCCSVSTLGASLTMIDSPEAARAASPEYAGDLKNGCRVLDVGVCDSDDNDTDTNLKSMNSTLESFSENAWDNYQDALYPSVSDDPTEEKLDDSNLQWEHNLEFEEEFHFDSPFGSDLRSQEQQSRKRSMISKVLTGYLSGQQAAEDSDSDLEDLHHIIEESRKQISVTESALRKHRKDVLDTGIYLDSSEYAELLATCQTNIRCLQVIGETLDSEEGLSSSVTDDDIQEVHDILLQWEELLGLAYTRQAQSGDIAAIYKELLSLKSTLQELTDEVDINSFDDVMDLETSIVFLQESKLEMHQHKCKMAALGERVTDFTHMHPNIPMGGFQKEMDQLQSMLDTMIDKSVARVSELQSRLLSWYDFNETHKELLYLLSQERPQLDCLNVSSNMINFSVQDTIDTIADLKAMQSQFAFYNDKMQSMRQLSADVVTICDSQSQTEIQSTVTKMETELTSVQKVCSDLEAAMQQHLNKINCNSTTTQTDSCIDAESDAATPRPSLLQRILRASIPLQVALVVAIGLAYLLEGDLGLTFNLDLRYVRGPPPT